MSKIEIRAYAKEKGLHPRTLDRWLGWQETDKSALEKIVLSLKVNENHLRDIMDWLEEVALRDHADICEVLSDQRIEGIMTDPRSGRSDKLKIIKEHLRRLRYPRLAATEDEVRNRIRALKLAPQIRLSVPAGLEGGRLHVEFTAGSVVELRALAVKLGEAAMAPEVPEIFALLSGHAGEVEKK
jgi:hypothetical protein